MSAQDGAQEVFASVTRITTLDVNGFPVAGANSFVTNAMLKASFAPAEETGVDLATINANGDLYSHYKHGDMPKYYTCQIEVGTPDPILHQMMSGGTVLSSSAAALTPPTGAAATAQTTLGGLANGVYGYFVTSYNQFGETAAGAEATATVTGPTGAVAVAGFTVAAGALGTNVYGRLPGGEQLIGSLVNIGTPATGAASGTGTVTSLTVGALAKPIPAGYTFQLSTDTNTPKITFTTTQSAGVNATALAVSAPTITVTIPTAGNLVPTFLDTGTVTPSGGAPSSSAGTAGPGSDWGYQAAPLGVVGNPNGVSLEIWGSAIINGAITPNLPFWRWCIPKVQNITEGGRTFQPAILENVYMGQGVENPNWGSGPFGDWVADSTKVYQYYRCGRAGLPQAGLAPVPATA